MGIIKISARLSVAAKPCDYCKSAPALLFCRQDGAFMCTACDAKVHNISKHARVWMCEVCEQAPAFVTCKADAASLCVACDRDIHSANPLASRHERVPVVPFYSAPEDSMAVKSMAVDIFGALGDDHEYKLNTCIAHTDYIHGSPGSVITTKVQSDGALGDDHGYKLDTCVAHTDYINDSPGSIITTKVQPDGQDLKSMDFLFTDSENYLDFDNYQVPSLQAFNDSVVPVQSTIKPPVQAQLTHDHSPENRFEIDFTRSNISYSYNNNSSYTTQSLSHSVSSSSMDVGVVPDGSSLSDISYTFGRNMNPTVDLNGNQGSQIVGMDREARVLRYKEKRKNRKFEKTIRYASRKAYAETRPRIKGRFAKKPESEPDMDRIFAGVDARYGVVPSF